MRALRWHGKHDIRCDNHVPDPSIEDPRDVIIKVSSCAICGSDLHLYDGFMPGMKHGDIMGHEFMGEVMEVGSGNKKLKGAALDDCYLGVDDDPAPLHEVVDWLRERLGVTHWAEQAMTRRAGSKRCSNARARALGWAPKYSGYRDGYGPVGQRKG